MCISKYAIIYAIAAALVMLLLTGLLNTTPQGLLGAAWHGLPLTWLTTMVIEPPYNPWALHKVNLVIDAVFWFVVALVVELAVRRMTRPKPARPKAKRRG